MNLDVDTIGLIDISLEDDFLIDKCFDDNSSVDLRLSVALEIQKELLSYAKPRGRVGLNDGIQLFGEKEVEMCRLQSINGDNSRYSLAWDTAFFTSPGFLELEELCLVNQGFKDPQRQSVCGDLENVRRKVALERNSGLKSDFSAGRRQNTQSIMKTRLASPTKMMAAQDSQRQLMKTRRSEATPGATSKSQVMQSTTGKKEYLKSGKATGEFRFVTGHTKKPPLQEASRNGKNRTPERLGMMMSRHPDARTASSVSSSLNLLSSTATNSFTDALTYRSIDYDLQTADLTKLQEAKDECFSDFHSPIPSGSRNNSVEEPSPRNSQKAKSPLPANSQLSPQPSSLRLPSEKIGYFDMNSGVTAENGSPLPCPEAHRSCDENIVTFGSTSVHTPINEAKHRLNEAKPKGTPPILKESKAHARNKAILYPENLQVVSSYDGSGKPSDKGHRRRNHYPVMKRTDIRGKEEKENMFHAEDIVIELKPKQRSPLPHPLAPNSSSVSNSSRKCPITSQRPARQAYLSPIGSRKTFSSKISPLKRSAFF